MIRSWFTVALFTMMASVAIAAPPRYSIKLLESSDGTRPKSGMAINNLGVVVGQARDADTRGSVVFRYADGAVTRVENSQSALAWAINDAEDMIVNQLFAYHVWWHDGRREELPEGLSASALNEKGQVTGTGYAGNGRHAMLYENGQAKDLGTLGGDYSYASSINELGQVTGSSDLAGGHKERGYLWQNGTMTALKTLGGDDSAGQVINDQGHIAGYADDAAGVSQTVIFAGDKITVVPWFQDAQLYIMAMNNHDQIVGDSSKGALLYDSGKTYRLKGLLDDTGAGWDKLLTAYGINDAGQIVGTGRFNGIQRVYLATPMTAP